MKVEKTGQQGAQSGQTIVPVGCSCLHFSAIKPLTSKAGSKNPELTRPPAIDSLSVNRLFTNEPMNYPPPPFRLGLGSATVPVAAVGVPPTAFRAGSFRPEAESGGRDARAPHKGPIAESESIGVMNIILHPRLSAFFVNTAGSVRREPNSLLAAGKKRPDGSQYPSDDAEPQANQG